MELIVPVSAGERVRGQLCPETAQEASSKFAQHGCVQLQGLFERSTIDILFQDYVARYGALGADEMHALATQHKPTSFVKRGDARYEITPRMNGGFGLPDVFANRVLVELLAPLLGADMQLSNFTLVVSHPGASVQSIHRDYYHLFAEPGVSANLPPHAINVIVPLIDVDIATGPTGVCPGSHRWPSSRQPESGGMNVVPIQRGDCILVDYRTLHAGLPNHSMNVRPIICMVYARIWFFDDSNHFGAKSVDISLEDYDRSPQFARTLLTRGLSQAMRAL